MPPEKTPRRLGRGLDALFNTRPSEPLSTPLREIAIDRIQRNPFQPRKDFSPEALAELKASLTSTGLLQPITVRTVAGADGNYELVAGERRFRAASELGWKTIPAVVKDLDDRQLLGLALVENLQREDLNPIEEAEGYSRLISEFGQTQQSVATMVGRDRSTIANMLRVLQLPQAVQQMLRNGSISLGHARPLLGLTDEASITQLADDVVKRGLSVREVEERVRQSSQPESGKKRGRPRKTDSRSLEVRNYEERLRRRLQTDVFISVAGTGAGSIKVSFYSQDDLERLLDLFGAGQISSLE